MKNSFSWHACRIIFICLALGVFSCKKFEQYNQKPELESLQLGIKTSAAVGYCASLAMSVFNGRELPSNVTIVSKSSSVYSSSWLMYIKIDRNHPLPFNGKIGDIVVAGIGDKNGGVISILFGDLDILGGNIKIYGVNLVPVQTEVLDDTKIKAMFFKQDIAITTNDVQLDLNLTRPQFNTKFSGLSSESSSDAYIAIKQNFWMIDIRQNTTYANIYDDDFYINGGGQIAEVQGNSGGVMYHALVDTRINYSLCSKNPIHGFALSQNFMAGGTFVDLGNSLISFHSDCQGIGHVDFSCGKYLMYNGKDIDLALQ